MNCYRLMLFKFGQQLTQEIAVNIARFYELPASTIDEIERKNPGTVLIRALEQRLIICENENKLREFYATLVVMKYLDLAEVLEEVYPQFKQATPRSPQAGSAPATHVMPNSAGSSSPTPIGEVTEARGPVMSPTSTATAAATHVMPNPAGSSSPTHIGEVTDGRRPVMSPTGTATTQVNHPVSNSTSHSKETTVEGRPVMQPQSMQDQNN